MNFARLGTKNGPSISGNYQWDSSHNHGCWEFRKHSADPRNKISCEGENEERKKQARLESGI